ncbi:MAG: hypothetical protein AAGA58_16395 [Verrucomicrobiota bacterium]
MPHSKLLFLLAFGFTVFNATGDRLEFNGLDPKRHLTAARASLINPEAKEYPEIGFVFGTEKAPSDRQIAQVDTSVKPRGKLVIWLMKSNEGLANFLTDEGFHYIQPHYANKWFSKVCQEQPVGPHCRGNVRLEAATGDDFSDEVDIAKPDGMMASALMFVKHLQEENPQGQWDWFLNESGDDLRWEDVIVAGSSHGSTTAARFAKHVRVSRVVCFAGPRDQYQMWQALPSATPENRYFAFTHVLDMGWTRDHYCRSWELMGLHGFGPIVNVESANPPFGNTRRLVTDFDVDDDPARAHGAVLPGKKAKVDKDGEFLHESVWRYLFTHPVENTGKPVPMDDGCLKEHPQ